MIPLQPNIVDDVTRALTEDIGQGDVTAALLPENQHLIATIVSNEPMLICGKPWVEEVFRQIDPTIQIDWLVREGDWLPKPQALFTVKGLSRALLAAERTALNFLQTLSGTATKVAGYVSLLKDYPTKLLDTRKTLPGLRVAQKYAVACGGGVNHRVGLYDAFLIKENHIEAMGSLSKAIDAARASRPDLFLEVEVETINELQEALPLKPDRILLDNFSVKLLKEAVQHSSASQIPLEASGGITDENLVEIAKTGVHFISLGELTKSVRAIDLSMRINDLKPND